MVLGMSGRTLRFGGALLGLSAYLFQLSRLQYHAYSQHSEVPSRRVSNISDHHHRLEKFRDMRHQYQIKHNQLQKYRTPVHQALDEFRKPEIMHQSQHIAHHHAKKKSSNNNSSSSFEIPQHACEIDGETVKMQQIPNFIIVGTQKGGTSALHGLLKGHPGIASSKKFEPHFFDRDEMMRQYRDNLDDPETLCKLRREYVQTVFPTRSLTANPRLTFEKSPAYMVVPGVPRSIHKVVPWAKVIITLRNPVDRAFSHFRMKRERNQEERELEDVLGDELSHLAQYPEYFKLPDDAPFEIAPVNVAPMNVTEMFGKNVTAKRHRPKLQGLLYRGCYAHQLRNWMRFFTLGENLLVINYERLDLEPEAVLKEILEFVDAPDYDFTDQAFNRSYSPSKHWSGRYTDPMPNSTRRYLEDFYRPLNERLADVLGEEWRGVWDKEHRSAARSTVRRVARPILPTETGEDEDEDGDVDGEATPDDADAEAKEE